ncbi:DUF4136 domain-containing protein [Sphingomonas hylomeconis]|uniref:DUF4136 domain-containing protein n=1 Tax=Sphingomonas hylomeconis TaxID=1395958 RepID=A0ABV7SSA6_9SPHN|nr:DUF4136 domain-containing protein [Sphingomonas hylomeconis]
MKIAALGLALAAAALAGCTTTSASGPVSVTRFHLGAPLERGSVTVEPLPGGAGPSLEFQTYADAVREQLLASGYSAPAAGPAQYLAVVSFARASREIEPRRSPVSIGLGGGGFSGGRRGGGLGLGGGVSFPIGKAKARSAVASELAVQIRRRSDGTVIWEGRAQTDAPETAPDAQANVAAGKLARALFQGFPGESGRSITVR